MNKRRIKIREAINGALMTPYNLVSNEMEAMAMGLDKSGA